MSFALPDLLTVERLARDVAARIILPRFGALAQSEIRAKTAPDDLVTIADTEAEAALTRDLRAAFSGAAVTGEETAVDGFDYAADPLLFVIDPVDGTWPFAHGLPIFGTMVAVLRHGEAIGGVIHYPVTQDSLLVLRGGGVHRLDAGGQMSRLAPLSQTARLETALLPLSQHDAAGRVRLAAAFGAVSRIVTIQCSALEYRMLAEGQADICLSTGLKPWDHHAGQLMLAELGGFAATEDGRQWPDVRPEDHLLSAANRASWERAMACLRGRAD
ncbi:inositol monophosphatase family protein [Falsirhodobacter algicola]|uniref:Inositol monophosphatase n=1 Tax=Falsirhodobacter algicola TaxID=2692330 RepID=A0A8J8MU43_9RHOB|nr:inositol monophosphatase [Falsirhodobacter algicola]QUS36338.1 inositol monophosphatase [Falsirhodobacter algicola]